MNLRPPLPDEELNIDFFKKAMDPVSTCLADSGLSKSKIAEVVMVDGSILYLEAAQSGRLGVYAYI